MAVPGPRTGLSGPWMLSPAQCLAPQDDRPEGARPLRPVSLASEHDAGEKLSDPTEPPAGVTTLSLRAPERGVRAEVSACGQDASTATHLQWLALPLPGPLGLVPVDCSCGPCEQGSRGDEVAWSPQPRRPETSGKLKEGKLLF